jgi:hypothetical protein
MELYGEKCGSDSLTADSWLNTTCKVVLNTDILEGIFSMGEWGYATWPPQDRYILFKNIVAYGPIAKQWLFLGKGSVSTPHC